MPEIQSTEMAIIGAGPIGIELAIALKRAGLDYLHFDARIVHHLTGQWPVVGTIPARNYDLPIDDIQAN